MSQDVSSDCPSGWTILSDADAETEPVQLRATALLHQYRADPASIVGVSRSNEWTELRPGESRYLSYRFEWHNPDAQNKQEHTGITVYQCLGKAAPPSGAAPTGEPSPEPPPSPPCP